MAQYSDEVSTCDSPPAANPAHHDCQIPKERRELGVSLLKASLGEKGTVLSAYDLLWIAAQTEADVHRKSTCVEAEYYRLLSLKLRENGLTKQLPDFLKEAAGTTCCVSEDSWNQIEHMKGWYRSALQACYVAMVHALKNPCREDSDSLKAFKRLVLGLVLFLTAPREKIPSKFTIEKLKRLEEEIVQILVTTRNKVESGVISLEAKDLTELFAAVERGTAHLRITGRPASSRNGSAEGKPVVHSINARELRPVSGKNRSILGKQLADVCSVKIELPKKFLKVKGATSAAVKEEAPELVSPGPSSSN